MNSEESQTSVIMTQWEQKEKKNQSEKIAYYLRYSSAYLTLYGKSLFCARFLVPDERPR